MIGEFTVTAFYLRCNACGTTADITGPNCRDNATAWFDAHHLPAIDVVDLIDDKGRTTTMRLRSLP